MRDSIFDLENGGRLIHEVDLYTSKYGMCHFLEAALNLMPQRRISVGTLHKAKWHLGQANKLFENEKKKLQQMNIKTILS